MAEMEKMYPISAYIKCIKHLALPYPLLGLKTFISEYTSKFTRQTNVDNIFFDGLKNVEIKKVVNANMSSQHIHDMLMGLVANHTAKSAIVVRYKFASSQLSKIWDPKTLESVPRILPPVGSFAIEAKKSPKTPSLSSMGIKAAMTPGERERLTDVVVEVNEGMADLEDPGWPGVIPKMTEQDAIDIIAAAEVDISMIINESDGRDLLTDVWIDYHGGIVIMELATWPSLPGVAPSDVLIERDPNHLLKAISSRLYKIKKVREVPIQKPKPLTPEVSKIKEANIQRIIKAKKEALVATPEVPEIKDNVRGMFSSLLPTHNTTLDVALNMFLGNFHNIKGVEKTGDHIYPVGRGAQFRWGIDSQYGDVIFIMKPYFWRNYTFGVTESEGSAPRITKDIVFNDFWSGKQTGEKEAMESLKREAGYFGFREPKVINAYADYCADKRDRENLTWCNTQIHIGENVSFDDIDAVLVPRYIGSGAGGSIITFPGPDGVPMKITDIIFQAQFNKTLLQKGNGKPIPNPFYQKIIEYGPSLDSTHLKGEKHPHYSIVLKRARKSRDPIYDKILEGYKVSDEIGDAEEKIAIKHALHRGRFGGHSSTIGLSNLAFIGAEEQYMIRLLEHNMTHT